MEIKDVEKKFEEAADNMELRSFSERWEVIKEDITIPPQKKKKSIKKWLPAVAAVCVVAISGAIIIPIALNNQPTGELSQPNSGSTENEDNPYFSNPVEYSYLSLNVTEMQQRMSAIHMPVYDTSQYEILSSGVYITEGHIDIGYYVEYTDDLDTSSFVIKIDAWNVEVVDWTVSITGGKEKNYTVNQTIVKYWLKSEQEGCYEYIIKAKHNNIYYQITHFSLNEDIEPFLDEFFK